MLSHYWAFLVYFSTLLSYSIEQSRLFETDLPNFLTSSQVFKVTSSGIITLPCEAANLSGYALVWKRGPAVLTAGNLKISPDPRLRLVDGHNLEIRDVNTQDAGDYTCQIATMKPREITHTLEVLVPPRIHYVTSNGRVEVKKGSSVRLECQASGNPVPAISWSRKNNLLPNGEQSSTKSILFLEHVDRHQAGIYQCTASNGVGEEAIQPIVLHVLYPPEILVERSIVHTGEGHEAQLVCIVHGENQPEVLWYRDTMQLDTTERRIMESRGSRHTLIIRKVHTSDFGNYTCVADNQLGKSRKSITLTGKPSPAKFQSESKGHWKDSYNISWTVESISPIEEYQLWFRKLSADNQQDQIRPLQHQSQQEQHLRKHKKDNYYMRPDGTGKYFGYPHRNSEWQDVILPAAYSSDNQIKHTMHYFIKYLEPLSHYEAKVQARNRFGWSSVSEPFIFETTDADMFLNEISQANRRNSDSDSKFGDFNLFFQSSSAKRNHISKYGLSMIMLLMLKSIF